jgi:hypothetical protein
MKRLTLFLLAAAVILVGQRPQTFTGVITDSECENGDHSRMQMGPTNAECTLACVRDHGASFVLFDGKSVYALSDQKAPEKFAGQRVAVAGTLDAKAKLIHVESISAAK